MAELSPEAKRLLAQLREVDDPTLEERASGDAAVRRMLHAQGMQQLPALTSPPEISKPLAANSGALVKLGWVLGAALVASVGFFGIEAWSSAHEPPRPSAVADPLPPAASGGVAAQPEPARTEPPAVAVDRAQLPSRTAGRAAPAHTLHHKPGNSANDSLAAELRLLASVDADIRAGSYDHALRQLQQHKNAASVLQEERAAMRVLALCGRDHDAHAERERDHFLQSHPSSLLNARVQSACTGAPRP